MSRPRSADSSKSSRSESDASISVVSSLPQSNRTTYCASRSRILLKSRSLDNVVLAASPCPSKRIQKEPRKSDSEPRKLPSHAPSCSIQVPDHKATSKANAFDALSDLLDSHDTLVTAITLFVLLLFVAAVIYVALFVYPGVLRQRGEAESASPVSQMERSGHHLVNGGRWRRADLRVFLPNTHRQLRE